MYCISDREWLKLESTMDLTFGRSVRSNVWSIKFFQGVAAGADLEKTPVLSAATKFNKYAQGALVIPSSETVIDLAVKYEICTPEDVKIAIKEKPEDAENESWMQQYKWFMLRTPPGVAAEWSYDRIIHWYRAFHILIPIPAGDKYAEEIIAAMVNGKATIDQAEYKRKGHHGMYMLNLFALL
ncbi:hypothetical protein T492DRAFT_15017 [Pavlovales sp. CCMP2436]|nr:hypothetical protein T492DRAFT_15017 [Pavlovales sp. CCMP2436]